MEIIDRVLFRMPLDRELQFPAMGCLQQYVNGFDHKAKTAIPQTQVGAKPEFRLVYEVEMLEEHWAIFLRAGLDLKRQPERLDALPDAVIDLRDERILAFRDSGKHASQACWILAGCATPAFPTIRRFDPPQGGPWGILGDLDCGDVWPCVRICADDLLNATMPRWMGIIARAGWETYLAASMALPVIEIVPAKRPRHWLSKFTNIAYRAVDEGSEDILGQIREAARSLERMARERQIVPTMLGRDLAEAEAMASSNGS